MKKDKQKFIEELAKYMVENQARKSILLETGDEQAKEWSKLRNLTPIFGWVSVDEAKQVLMDFLG